MSQLTRGDPRAPHSPRSEALREGDLTPPLRRTRLRHQVFFWLKNPTSTEDRHTLISGLEKLRAVDVVRSLQIGLPAKTEARPVVDASFSVSELMLFDSEEDQVVYQADPLHLQFLAECEHLWEKVIVYDSVDL